MFLRSIKKSLLKRPKTVALTLLSIMLGSAVATAFLGMAGDISRKMALELRKYGANILVEPLSAGMAAGGHLREEDLPRIKTVFWKYNITGFTPYLLGKAELSSRGGSVRGMVAGVWFAKRLEVAGEPVTEQGVKITSPWWSVQGRYPAAADECVVGEALARRLGVVVGDVVEARHQGRQMALRVSGLLKTGGQEDDELFAPLVTVQQLLAMPGKVSRVLVSALTVPMDDFGRRDPATMDKLEYEKWYCTAYVTSVAKNIEEAMVGSRAKPVWRIAEAEGALLGKINVTVYLLTGLALAAASFAVSASLTAALAERRKEISLMKAIGADRVQIAQLIVGEVFLVALAGGVAGYLLGGRIADLIGQSVFNAPVPSPAWLFPTALLSAFLVALLGAALPTRRALASETVRGLKA